MEEASAVGEADGSEEEWDYPLPSLPQVLELARQEAAVPGTANAGEADILQRARNGNSCSQGGKRST